MEKYKLFSIIMLIAALSFPIGSSAVGPALNRVLIDADGVRIGQVIGMDNIHQSYVLTDNGYRTLLDMKTGKVRFRGSSAYFAEADCGGQAYIVDTGYLGTVYHLDGVGGAPYGIFHTPQDEPMETILINSAADSFFCFPLGPAYKDVWPAYANNPSVTGIKSEGHPALMRIK